MPNFSAEIAKNDEDAKLALWVFRMEPNGERRLLTVSAGLGDLNAAWNRMRQVMGSMGDPKRVVIAIETT